VSRRSRRVVFLPAAAAVGWLLVWGLVGLPDFGRYRGPYGDVVVRSVVPQRHATEAVTSVVFDFRGLDTMGEEFILFAAAIGAALLLRAGRGEVETEPGSREEARILPPTTDPVRALGVILVGPTLLFGLSLVAHGHLTPGGGFQGGLVLATASVLVFLTGRFLWFHRLNPLSVIDAAEGLSAAAFPAIGLAGLLAGSAFLQNVLPLGRAGDLLSAGTLPLLNISVGIEVAAAFVLIVSEFLEQTLAIRRRR
jgi:multicomponent Na+:H+ antiporter subunit B